MCAEASPKIRALIFPILSDEGASRMSRFRIRRDVNRHRSLCHVINFLTSCEIMSLEDSRPMFYAFHSRGEDVVVDIPDDTVSRFEEAMDIVNIQYEKI